MGLGLGRALLGFGKPSPARALNSDGSGIIVCAFSSCFRFAFDQRPTLMTLNINLTRRVRRRKLKDGSVVEQTRYVLNWRDPRTGEREQRC